MAHVKQVQYLTVEIDFSRQGMSIAKDAPLFANNLSRLTVMIETLVDGLKSRSRDGNKMADLHLQCRRYQGFRRDGCQFFSYTAFRKSIPER